MSFIRCLSNPEGLYAYHHTDGYIALHADQLGECLANPLVIPLREWGYLKRHYRRYLDMEFTRPTLRVKECYTRAGTDIEHPEPKDWLKNNTPLDNRLCLSVKTKGRWRHLYLWDVTYRYMMDNAIRQDDRRNGKKVAI